MSIPTPHKTAAILIIALLLAACRPNPQPTAEDAEPAATSEPPATSDQPPATSNQPPTTSHQPPAPTDQPPATSDQPPATNTPLPSALLPDLGPAPDITNEIWLNTDRPLNLAALQGEVVLLEFWTFG